MEGWILSVLICLCIYVSACCAETDYIYGVIIDAGSSGSRVRIYQTTEKTNLYTIPKIRELSHRKTKPGISTFQNKLTGLRPYITGLVDHASQQIPANQVSSTPIYLMATAGMRLLLEDNATSVIDAINIILQDTSINPFIYSKLNCRILSGEEEGVFAWIAVNYLLGLFVENTEKETQNGVLEMGGGSMQVTFRPQGSILANKFPVRIAGRWFPLYVHSYLSYGQEQANDWVFRRLHMQQPSASVLDNVCMLRGDSKTKEFNGRTVTFNGVGDFDACQTILEDYVYKVEDHQCYPKECTIGNVYQPSVEEKQFYAVSAFIFTLKGINAVPEDGKLVPNRVVEAGQHFCSLDFEEAQEFSSDKPEFLSSDCLMSAYIPLLLTRGFGFSADTTQISVVDKIEDERLEWSLGAIIYEMERAEIIRPSIGYQISEGSSFQFSKLNLLASFALLILLSLWK